MKLKKGKESRVETIVIRIEDKNNLVWTFSKVEVEELQEWICRKAPLPLYWRGRRRVRLLVTKIFLHPKGILI
jgi:hypothetical protein